MFTRIKSLRKPLYENAFYLILSTAVMNVLGFLYWFIAARLYSDEDVGLVSAVIAAAGILSILSEFGLGISLIRFLPLSEGEKGNEMINSCINVCTYASLVLTVIFIAGLDLWSPSLISVRRNIMFLIFFLIFTPTTTLNSLTNHIFVAKRAARFELIANAIRRPLSILLVVIFAFVFNSAYGLFVSSSFSLLFGIILTIVVFIPKVQKDYRFSFSIKTKYIKEMYSYSAGNYITKVFLQLPSHIFPVMVANILGPQQNAYFSMVWWTVSIINVLTTSISNSMFAEGSYQEKTFRKDASRALKMTIFALVLIVLLFLIISDKLLLLFGRSYSENGATLLRIMSLSVIPWSINYIYITIGRIEKSIGNLIKVSVASAVTTVGFGYFMILKMGLNGAGFGWALGQTIVAIPTAFYVFRSFILMPRK